MRFLGKTLQLVGLLILPLAMAMQLSDLLGRALHVSQMVFMMLFGVAAFSIGRLVEGYARR